MELSNRKTKPHVVLLSAPAHVSPVVELGKRLVSCQNLKVTIFVASFVETAARTVQSVTSTELYDVIHLPPPDISGILKPSDKGSLTSLAVAMRRIRPHFQSAMSALESPPTALIVHLFAVECLSIADELKIPKFVYCSTHAWFLALTIYSPILDKMVEGEYHDLKEPIVLPGCEPVRPQDLPDPMVSRTKQSYLEYIQIGLETQKSNGILVNTWEELQPKTLAALRDGKLLGDVAKVPIFPIGPITSEESPTGLKSEITEWLNKQPSKSVVYISFGSIGGLSQEQMTELAWGLELSQQRYIWVVRAPVATSGVGSVPVIRSELDVLSYLPEGFVSRTQGMGLVIPQWAPQLEILSHPSVGGFLSHCGWNSALECITNGVPIIAWPLYAEQKMNATMLTEELRVAVRSETAPTEGVVGREEIKSIVRKIIVDEEGRQIRARVVDLKLSAGKAWDRDGTSFDALAQLVKHFVRREPIS